MNNIYLVYGNNYSLIKKEIDKITNGTLDVVKYDLSLDKIDLLLDDASCISLFGEKKVLIGENALFLTSESTNVLHDIDYLEKYINNDNNDNIVILSVLSEKLDERKKIVKLLRQKATVYQKEVINEKDLGSYVVKEFKNNNLNINLKTANYFVDYVGKDIDIIQNEIDKMVLFKEDDTVTIDDINDISSRAFKDNIFDFTDAILKKNYKKMFECYNDLMRINEEPIKIISMLGTQFIFIYQVKLLNEENKSQKEITDILKVHPYRVKLALESDYMTSEVVNMIKGLHELDYGIKCGNLDKNVALENFLLRI